MRRAATSAMACECGDHCFLNLNGGFVTLFDPEDAKLTIKGSFWARAVSKRLVYVIHKRYVGIGKNKSFRFHREILGAQPDIQVDHKFGNGLDNRKRNLRLASRSQNQRNKNPREGCSSQYLGVSWDSHKSRWMAVIQSNGKVKRIGAFRVEEDAATAYDRHAIEIHGEFARLNFPNGKIAASG